MVKLNEEQSKLAEKLKQTEDKLVEVNKYVVKKLAGINKDVVDKLAEKLKEDEKSNLTKKQKEVEDARLIKKAKLINEPEWDKFRRRYIGPFQFLLVSLITSESLLAFWMYGLVFSTNAFDTINNERIVVGSLSIAVLIAVLVVFSVVYNIKKSHGDCEH